MSQISRKPMRPYELKWVLHKVGNNLLNRGLLVQCMYIMETNESLKSSQTFFGTIGAINKIRAK